MANTPFKLRSGNTTSFKEMGSSPVKHSGSDSWAHHMNLTGESDHYAWQDPATPSLEQIKETLPTPPLEQPKKAAPKPPKKAATIPKDTKDKDKKSKKKKGKESPDLEKKYADEMLDNKKKEEEEEMTKEEIENMPKGAQ